MLFALYFWFSSIAQGTNVASVAGDGVQRGQGIAVQFVPTSSSACSGGGGPCSTSTDSNGGVAAATAAPGLLPRLEVQNSPGSGVLPANDEACGLGRGKVGTSVVDRGGISPVAQQALEMQELTDTAADVDGPMPLAAAAYQPTVVAAAAAAEAPLPSGLSCEQLLNALESMIKDEVGQLSDRLKASLQEVSTVLTGQQEQRW
jgi:hypothetical protein